MKIIVKKSVEIYNQNRPHFYQLFIDSQPNPQTKSKLINKILVIK